MNETNGGLVSSLARQAAELCIVVAAALVLAVAFRATVAEAYEIPTESMESTIMIGDRVIAEKLSIHFRSPVPGDVVVIDDPTGGAVPFVKRVVAIEGQTVDIRDGSVWVDDVRLDETYTHELPSEPDRVALPVTVPTGHAWVMGDNRTRSKDSRYFGPVPVSTIRARALAVYWPLQHWGDLAVSAN